MTFQSRNQKQPLKVPSLRLTQTFTPESDLLLSSNANKKIVVVRTVPELGPNDLIRKCHELLIGTQDNTKPLKVENYLSLFGKQESYLLHYLNFVTKPHLLISDLFEWLENDPSEEAYNEIKLEEKMLDDILKCAVPYQHSSYFVLLEKLVLKGYYSEAIALLERTADTSDDESKLLTVSLKRCILQQKQTKPEAKLLFRKEMMTIAQNSSKEKLKRIYLILANDFNAIEFVSGGNWRLELLSKVLHSYNDQVMTNGWPEIINQFYVKVKESPVINEYDRILRLFLKGDYLGLARAVTEHFHVTFAGVFVDLLYNLGLLSAGNGIDQRLALDLRNYIYFDYALMLYASRNYDMFLTALDYLQYIGKQEAIQLLFEKRPINTIEEFDKVMKVCLKYNLDVSSLQICFIQNLRRTRKYVECFGILFPENGTSLILNTMNEDLMRAFRELTDGLIKDVILHGTDEQLKAIASRNDAVHSFWRSKSFEKDGNYKQALDMLLNILRLNLIDSSVVKKDVKRLLSYVKPETSDDVYELLRCFRDDAEVKSSCLNALAKCVVMQ